MRWAACTAALSLGVACTKANPDYCEDSTTCTDGLVCIGHSCVEPPPGPATPCPAEVPVCEGGACRPCAVDDECATGVCRDDGACEPEDALIHVAPAGATAGSCDAAAPCELTYARGQVRPDRHTMLLE